MMTTRREFIKALGIGGAALVCSPMVNAVSLSGNRLTDGQWHYYAVTRTRGWFGITRVTHYLDGRSFRPNWRELQTLNGVVLLGPGLKRPGMTMTTWFRVGGPAYCRSYFLAQDDKLVGRDMTIGGGPFDRCSIDNVSVYNQVLSDEVIRYIYNKCIKSGRS